MTDYNFYGFYTATKTGKTGLTITCTVYGPGGTEASAQAATGVGGGTQPNKLHITHVN